MIKKALTASEKRHLDRKALIGCIVCRNLGEGFSEAEIHHINCGTMGKRSGHRLSLPLCPSHHRHEGGLGVGIHAGKETWEGLYGTEWELLDQVIELMEEDNDF